MLSSCYEFNLVSHPPNSYVEVQISECDFIWRQGLYKSDQVKMTGVLLKGGNLDSEILIEKRQYEEIQKEDGLLQAYERD